ncbi:MAG: hypothetical protein ACOVMN_12320 [Flexibacteraceae bacterium]
MVKFGKWVLVFVCSVLAFSCSTTKEITLSNDKVKLQTEASTSNGVIDNERVHTISFASMVETTNQLDFKETEKSPLFKAIPDSVLEYVPTIAEHRQSLEEEALSHTEIYEPQTGKLNNDPNFFGNTALILGYIALFSSFTVFVGYIFAILTFIYAYKAKRASEPNRKLARSANILAFISLFLVMLFAIVWLGVWLSTM